MKHTLKDNRDFNRILKKGKKLNSAHFMVAFMNSDEFAYGIITAKKVGNSVERHTIQRIFRELLREKNFKDKTVVLLSRPGSGALPKDAIRGELSALVERIK